MKQNKVKNNLNKVLKNYNQNLRILRYNCNLVKFNNGFVLTDKKIIKRMYRRLYFNYNHFIKRADELYISIESEKRISKEIRKKRSSKGGKVVQKLYGEKIWKENLNNKEPWNKGTKGLTAGWNKGLTKNNDERLKKLSESRKGKGNPMWGRTHTDIYKKNSSDYMKKLIKDGKFTPNIHNSNTHWQSKVGNQKYRSSWEAAYHLLNPKCNYETVRIPYKINGKERIYIVDFEDKDDKKLIEIKPSTHKDSSIMKNKKKSADEWCRKNGYTFEILTEKYILNNFQKIDMKKLDRNSRRNLKKLYETYKKEKDR